MAQPRSFLGGHLLATLVGLGFRLGHVGLGGPVELWAAAAVGAALAAMAATRTIHSPAGANPLVVFAEQAGPGFLVAPLLPGLGVLFAVAFLVNNLARPARIEVRERVPVTREGEEDVEVKVLSDAAVAPVEE